MICKMKNRDFMTLINEEIFKSKYRVWECPFIYSKEEWSEYLSLIQEQITRKRNKNCKYADRYEHIIKLVKVEENRYKVFLI